MNHRDELESLGSLVAGAVKPISMVITLRPDGMLAIQAPIGDKAFCLKLLEEARYAIQRQADPAQIVIPGEDVDSRPKASYQ